MTPTTALKQYFGYDNFRTGQAEIIDNILQKRDAFAIMPTGAGKSLCFQIPALLMPGITIVVSPLISLMQDQVHTLVQSGVHAAYINSSLSTKQISTVITRAAAGQYKIIYVAPERLETWEFIEFAKNTDISMVAVDEAHCVSHWGQDFRPSYLTIDKFIKELYTRPVVAAFTATATDIVKDDVIQLLALRSPFVRTTGFDRKNLYFGVQQPKDKTEKLSQLITGYQNASGIVYCATKKAVDTVTEKLCQRGFLAKKYHAGMPQDERTKNQNDFIYDRAQVMVATNAFGMGIDKSNVSYVIHYNMPKNLESYYQEAGRAGRDGSPADCILLFSRQDVVINQFLIEQSNLDQAQPERERDYKRLREMERYCTTTNCLRQYILDYFGDTDICECKNCSSCNTSHKIVDVTIDAQKILSCVHKMHGRFGLTTVIDVLKGSSAKRIISQELDQLSTYGIMNDKTPEVIMQIAQFLIQEGYIRVQGSRYPTVSTSEHAWDILRNTTKVELPLDTTEEPRQNQTQVKKSTNAKSVGAYTVDPQLFSALKALRLNLATSENMPAFVVFSDATLYDMCTKLPVTSEDFLKVSGVGETKLAKYGNAFISEISQYMSNKPPADQASATNANFFGESVEPIYNKNSPISSHTSKIDELIQNFSFSEDAINISTFMDQANIILLQTRGRATASSAITKLLEADGFLETTTQPNGSKSRTPTPEGVTIGIEQQEETNHMGDAYMRNYYNAHAQRKMLEYIKTMAERT